MTEFEAGMHYLKDPMGADVEALEELPAAAKCVGDVNMSQVGGKQAKHTLHHAAFCIICLHHVDTMRLADSRHLADRFGATQSPVL